MNVIFVILYFVYTALENKGLSAYDSPLLVLFDNGEHYFSAI